MVVSNTTLSIVLVGLNGASTESQRHDVISAHGWSKSSRDSGSSWSHTSWPVSCWTSYPPPPSLAGGTSGYTPYPEADYHHQRGVSSDGAVRLTEVRLSLRYLDFSVGGSTSIAAPGVSIRRPRRLRWSQSSRRSLCCWRWWQRSGFRGRRRWSLISMGCSSGWRMRWRWTSRWWEWALRP